MRNAILLILIHVGCISLVGFAARSCAAGDPEAEGVSSREARADATRRVPFHRLNQQTGELIKDVIENPSFYRRMPAQEIECDPQMFTFLVRRPEVMVNIWELMGITQVSTKRTSPYSFLADDGAGTTARCDLVYGDDSLHIYYGNGMYDGSMTPRKMRGRCVCILHSSDAKNATGKAHVAGTMDVFLKLDNFGADLLTRTLGPFVGKTADYNFIETAKFMSQISQICSHNPAAAQGLAMQLNRVDDSVRQEFAAIAAKIAANAYTPPPETELSQSRVGASYPAATGPIRSPEGERRIAAQRLEEREDWARPTREVVESSRRATDSTASESGEDASFSFRLADRPQPVDSKPPTALRPSKPNIYMRR